MKEYTVGTLEDALMELHDRAMSKDQWKACEGRLGKAMANCLSAWMADESQRGTDLATMLLVAKSAPISAFFTAILNGLPPNVRAEVATHLRQPFMDEYDRCIERIGEISEKESP